MHSGGFFQAASDNEPRQDYALKGIFIHPDHLAAGFLADESPSLSSSESSSVVDYSEDESVAEQDVDSSAAALTGLALTCGYSSDAQEAMHDYFAPRPGSCNPSPFYSNSTTDSGYSELDVATPSASSSPATNPTTCDMVKSPSFSRRSSCLSIYSDVASPSLPATFSFGTFAPTNPQPPRAPSPSRSHPYARPSKTGAAMMRSVSSPVETQRQLEARQRAMSIAETAIDERAVKMARSKSTASSPITGSLPFGGMGMARSSKVPSRPLYSPLTSTFGESWGSALPPREFADSELNTFPYNVARPALSPLRTTRAHSFAGNENLFTPPPSVGHRNSLPTADLAAGSDSLSSPSSPTLVRQARRRSRMMDFSFTPIIPQSPEQDSPTEMAPPLAPSTPRNRLHRGMTF
ncbi:hypothetical protein JCM10207_005177 [Rhodosporidiobolus poonsookiae]